MSESFRFLIRNEGKKSKAHIWIESDTACRMWSTEGIKKSRYSVTETRGDREICHMCAHIFGVPESERGPGNQLSVPVFPTMV
jgi:hypothetical protein